MCQCLTSFVSQISSISCARTCAKARRRSHWGHVVLLLTLARYVGIREQQGTNPERVISDRAMLLHKREGRKAAAGCRQMGCAGRYIPRSYLIDTMLTVSSLIGTIDRQTWSKLYEGYFDTQCDEFPPGKTASVMY